MLDLKTIGNKVKSLICGAIKPAITDQVIPKTESFFNGKVVPTINEKINPKIDSVIEDKIKPIINNKIYSKVESMGNENVTSFLNDKIKPFLDKKLKYVLAGGVCFIIVIGYYVVSPDSKNINGDQDQIISQEQPAIGQHKVAPKRVPSTENNPAISSIRNGKMGFDQSTTIGNAIENYSYFKETWWSSFQDRQKRTYVEFHATFDMELYLQYLLARDEERLQSYDKSVNLSYFANAIAACKVSIANINKCLSNKRCLLYLENELRFTVCIQFQLAGSSFKTANYYYIYNINPNKNTAAKIFHDKNEFMRLLYADVDMDQIQQFAPIDPFVRYLFLNSEDYNMLQPNKAFNIGAICRTDPDCTIHRQQLQNMLDN